MIAYSLSTEPLNGLKFRAKPDCSKVIKKGLFKFKILCEETF